MTEFDRYVDGGDDAVYDFCDACRALSDVKFIMAERSVSELLVMIATSSKLQAIVANACRGFDFPAAFAKARVRSGGRYTLLPPSAPRDLIAFAVNLLYAFDTHSVPLGEFLDEYYYSGNGVSFAFAAFAKNIVTPLADCVEKELRAFSSAAREERAAEPETVSEVEPLLPDEAVADIVNRIADLCDIAEQSGATKRELEDLYGVAGSLADCVNKRDVRMVRPLMTGLRGVVSASRQAAALGEKVDELDETFRHFGV